MKLIKSFLAILFILNCSIFSFASHILGGEMSHQTLGNGKYIVQVKLYRDCNGLAVNNTVPIDIYSPEGCFPNSFSAYLPLVSFTDITNVCPSEPTVCSGSPTATYGVEEYIYSDTIDASIITAPCTTLTFQWRSCCRLGSLSTINNPLNTGIRLYSTTYKHGTLTSNQTPSFVSTPIFNTCAGHLLDYAQDITDIDGDSIALSLTPCNDSPSGLVQYSSGYSATQPFTAASITLNPQTGLLQFMPTVIEIGVLCIKVEEYRNGILIGEKMRDTQLTIGNCTNQNPKISGMNGTATANGTTGNYIVTNIEIGQFFCFDISTFDSDANQNVTLEHSNNLSGAAYTINNGTHPSLNVCWTPTINDVGVHFFSVAAIDDNCPIIGKSIKTYRLTVLPPFTIEGTVNLSSGNLYDEGIIYLMDSTKQVIDSIINTTGNYQFPINDINNSYHLSVVPNLQSQNLDKTYYNEQPVIQYATNIPIVTRTRIANITILDTVIGVGPSVIQGIIKDANTNLPIPNIRVVVVNQNFDYLKSSTSKADGSIEFYNLTYNQDYSLWVDQLGIDNNVAPIIRFSSIVPKQINLEFKLHDTYLELLYPTNTNGLNDDNTISITPNPSNGIFNIDFSKLNENPKLMNVIDINGKIIRQFKFDNSNLQTINLTDLPNQIYFLQIITDDGVILKKIYKS